MAWQTVSLNICFFLLGQASGQHLLQGSESAGAAAVRGDLGEPWAGAEPHGESHGPARAAHGAELLPAVPAAGAHLRAAGPQGPKCHHAAAPGRRVRPPGAARRPLGCREPRAQRAGHQHRRSAAGICRSSSLCTLRIQHLSEVNFCNFNLKSLMTKYIYLYSGAE
jgi:hypothetical protein